MFTTFPQSRIFALTDRKKMAENRDDFPRQKDIMCMLWSHYTSFVGTTEIIRQPFAGRSRRSHWYRHTHLKADTLMDVGQE